MTRGKLSLAVSDSPRKLCFWWLQAACSPSFIGPLSPWLRKSSCWADDTQKKKARYSIHLERCFYLFIYWRRVSPVTCHLFPIEIKALISGCLWKEKEKRNHSVRDGWGGELNALVTLYELNIRMNNLVVEIRGQTQTEARAAFSRRRLM